MDKLFTLCLIILVSIFPETGKALVVQQQAPAPQLRAVDLNLKNRGQSDKKIGEDLKLREKIALRLLKRKTKRNGRQIQNQSNEQSTDGFAFAGFATGLLGILGLLVFAGTSPILFGLGFGVLAVTFSIIGLKRINRKPELKKGKFFALAGLFLGSTLLLIALLGGIGYLM